MPSSRPNMNLRTTSSGSSSSPISPTSSTTSPTSPLSPSSPKANGGYFGGRQPKRAITIDTVFGSSRSKLPKPPHDLPSGSELKHSKTSPATPTARHKSEGALPNMPDRKDSFFKQKQHTGNAGHIGRHSNQWLFGNVSFTETAKGILVRPRHDSK